jgi:transcriptional regulator with XRE-family HTH domain
MSEATLSKYLSGSARPTLARIRQIAQREGVSVDWLLTGQGPAHLEEVAPETVDWILRESGVKGEVRQMVQQVLAEIGRRLEVRRVATDRQVQGRRIPVLAELPIEAGKKAKSPQAEGPDLLAALTGPGQDGRRLIALPVPDSAMQPTLHQGDLVVMEPARQVRCHPGDLVVVQVGEATGYLVRRLGKQTRTETTLVPDDPAQPPVTHARTAVHLRGRVAAVVWRPSDRPPVEPTPSPVRQLLGLLESLEPTHQQVILRTVRQLAAELGGLA